MRETPEGRRTRVTVTGELDLSTVERFEHRLRAVRAKRRAVRLDLSRLEFIDAVGLAAVIRALRDRPTDLPALEVDPEVSPQVKRLIALLGGRGLEDCA
jgi:anti-anti-sigma factor